MGQASINMYVGEKSDTRAVVTIVTIQPEGNFPLSIGDWIELLEEEILYYIPVEGYLKDRVVN